MYQINENTIIIVDSIKRYKEIEFTKAMDNDGHFVPNMENHENTTEWMQEDEYRNERAKYKPVEYALDDHYVSPWDDYGFVGF